MPAVCGSKPEKIFSRGAKGGLRPRASKCQPGGHLRMEEGWSALHALENPESGSESEALSSGSEISRHVYHLEQRLVAVERVLDILNNQVAHCLEHISHLERALPVHINRVSERVGRLEEIDRVAEALVQDILARVCRLEVACQLNTLD